MDPTPSSISLYWTRLFGAKILLCGYKVAGLYDGSPPTARALNWPHCRKKRDEAHLLYTMGWETANVHLGTHKAIRAIQRDLATRKPKWLHRAAKQMTRVTISDWREWRKTSFCFF